MQRRVVAEDFVSSFVEQFAATGLSLPDFTSFLHRVEDRLKEIGVVVSDELCVTLANDPAVRQASSEIYQMFQQRYWTKGTDMHPDISDHDGFHKVLIETLRGRAPNSFFDAKAWFLTFDRKLPPYAYRRRAVDGAVPFCARADLWAQLVGSLLPRTGDFQKTNLLLLSSPYLRSSTNSVTVESIYETYSRLAAIEKESPEIATRILLDRRFQDRLELIPDEDLSETVVAKVFDESMVEFAEELIAKLDQSETQVKEFKEATEELKRRLDERDAAAQVPPTTPDLSAYVSVEELNAARAQLSELLREREALNEQASRERERAEEQKKAVAKEIAKRDEALADATRRARKKEETLSSQLKEERSLRQIFGWVGVVGIMAFSAVVMAVWWNDFTVAGRVIGCSAAVIGTVTLAGLPLGFQSPWWRTVEAIGVVASVVGVIYALAQSS
jgi:hypothetical protein